MNATTHLTLADIEKLSNFRSGLRQYLHSSHLFCEIFELTDLQYIFLLTVKALEGSKQASYQNLKERLELMDSALTKLIKRSLQSDLLALSPGPSSKTAQTFQLSQAGNKLIETLAAMHKKEFETFQMRFTNQCDTRCESPICWKGSD